MYTLGKIQIQLYVYTAFCESVPGRYRLRTVYFELYTFPSISVLGVYNQVTYKNKLKDVWLRYHKSARVMYFPKHVWG